LDQGGRVLDHVDVGEDEAGFGGLGVQAPFERADEAEVRVSGVAGGWVVVAVVVESVCCCVRHEWRDVDSGKGKYKRSVAGFPKSSLLQGTHL
jgi:hypothetical protein